MKENFREESKRRQSIKEGLLVMRGEMDGVLLVREKGTAEEQLIQRHPFEDGSIFANKLRIETDRKLHEPWRGVESLPPSFFCDKCHALSHIISSVHYGPDWLCMRCASDRYIELMDKFKEEKNKDGDLSYWVYITKGVTTGKARTWRCPGKN